jgi:hypothetical protein
VAEKWAQKCAKLEKGASGFLLEATQEYAAKQAQGWSAEKIAAEVTAAGFSIGSATIGRRLRALSEVEGTSAERVEEAFAEAYLRLNAQARGNEDRVSVNNLLPKNEEGLYVTLERAAQKLQREHGWTEQEVLATIRESTVKPKAAPAKAEKAPEPTRYETLVEILELIRDLFGDKPFTQREQTKAQEIVLELEVLMGVNV